MCSLHTHTHTQISMSHVSPSNNIIATIIRLRFKFSLLLAKKKESRFWVWPHTNSLSRNDADVYTVEPLHSGHLWGNTCWPLERGGLFRGGSLFLS